MKILVVCQYYYPEPFRITDICEELSKRGNQVTVLTGLPNYPEGEVLKEYKKKEHKKFILNSRERHRGYPDTSTGDQHGSRHSCKRYHSSTSDIAAGCAQWKRRHTAWRKLRNQEGR